MKTKLITFGSLAVLFFFILRLQGAGLITETTPLGIVNFEFADTAEKLNAILFGWSNAALACSAAWVNISMKPARAKFLIRLLVMPYIVISIPFIFFNKNKSWNPILGR